MDRLRAIPLFAELKDLVPDHTHHTGWAYIRRLNAISLD
jgi:hypothetical protein